MLVGAGEDFYNLALSAGIAAGAVAVTPAVGVNVINNTTSAFIDTGATVNTFGDVSVIATAQENIIDIGIGLAGGAVGVGGVVDVGSITTHTTATIGDNATVLAAGTAFVSANDDTHIFSLSGALAGGFVGVGASVGVMILDKTTLATIGDSAVDGLGHGNGVNGVFDGTIQSGKAHGANVAGVVVQAASTEDVLHIVAAGGFGFVGVSGAVGVTLINGETDARIKDNAQINQSASQFFAGPNEMVAVGATDNATIKTFVVGVAGGFVGIGGAVDVGHLDNNVKAEIQGGADVAARNGVWVNAVGLKDLEGFDISGAGGFVGAAAAVNVWSIGTQLTSTYSDKDGKSADAVGNDASNADKDAGKNAGTSTDNVTNSVGGAFKNDGGNQNTGNNRLSGIAGGAASTVSSKKADANSVHNAAYASPVTSATEPSGTAALIHANSVIRTFGDVNVTAREQLTVNNHIIGAGVGAVGIGAAISVLTINDNVTAASDGSVQADGDVTVQALQTETTDTLAVVGVGGIVGLGAGVIVINDTGITQASLNNVSGFNGGTSKAGDVTVLAQSTRTYTEHTDEVAVGAIAAGAVFTKLNVGAGGVFAIVDDGATIEAKSLNGDGSIRR